MEKSNAIQLPVSAAELEAFLKAGGALQSPKVSRVDATRVIHAYHGSLYFVDVVLQATGGPMTMKMVLKHRQPGQDQFDVFGKEAAAYSIIIPQLLALGKHMQPQPFIAPKCFYAGDNLLVLEDLNAQGFEMRDKTARGLDLHHAKAVLSQLAGFHALSFAMKNGDSDKLRNLYGQHLKEVFHTQADCLAEIFSHGLPTSLSIIAKEPGYKAKIAPLEQKVSSVDQLKEFWRSQLTPQEPLALICHGDVWTNNFLWRGAADKQGEGLEVRILDYQVFRYGNPSLDISNFLCICVHADVLSAHFDELLTHYHTRLTDTLTALQAPLVSHPSLAALRADYARFGLWGLVNSLQWLPVMMGLGTDHRSPDLAADLKKSKDPKSVELQRRLCGLVDLYHQRGWL